jgi:hypothetical protein
MHLTKLQLSRVSYAAIVKLTVVALSLLTSSVMFSEARLVTPNVTVGQNLETGARIILNQAVSNEGLTITLTSNDPTKVLLSTGHDSSGSRTINIRVPAGLSKSPEFFVQALDKTGTATYTAGAPGYESSTGTVTFAPSGIVIAASSRYGNPLMTVAGSRASKISVYSALLDSSRGFVEVQPVRHGLSVVVDITSSSTDAGTLAASQVTIEGGSSSATTEFRPGGPGETILAVNVPTGFSPPALFATVVATVRTPGIGLLDEVSIGENLEVRGYLTLGRPAPPEGLTVTLTSNNPNKLLLSAGATSPGSESITISIPAGGTGAAYYPQALSDSGTVTYAASAPGYLSRTATVTLTPSGVILGLLAPPDEAELFRKEAAEDPHGFLASLSSRSTVSLMVYTAQLHPIHHRAADITVQTLRAGLSITIALQSSNPTVGTIDSPVIIPAGSKEARARFTALSPGSTVISVATPHGFTTAGNATSMTAIVQK